MSDPLRKIPAVEKVLQALGSTDLPRPVVTALVRRALAHYRHGDHVPEFEAILAAIRASIDAMQRARIQPVINGTGVLVHTNLGRAPLGREVVEALTTIAGSYNNLEYDLTGGERGGRAAYLEHNLALLCGAGAATVVNNCAAALVLTVQHFTRVRPEVIISRGELIQIGGGFRIPEILQASGARLREVGTTNKTALSDYADAIGPDTGLILKVHRSNFYMDGFVDSPSTEQIAELAKTRLIPFVEDLGRGAIAATDQLGLEHEPTPAETLNRGVDLVTFSGDKLLGGPQAGIIAGKADWIAALKREPFLRALRCDRLVLSALQATVDIYLRGEAEHSIPILAMLRATPEELRNRAAAIISKLGELPLEASIGTGKGQMGGGALPRSNIASVTIDLQPQHENVTSFSARLRRSEPPVIGYVAANRLKLDLRTVLPAQDILLAKAIVAACQTAAG